MQQEKPGRNCAYGCSNNETKTKINIKVQAVTNRHMSLLHGRLINLKKNA